MFAGDLPPPNGKLFMAVRTRTLVHTAEQGFGSGHCKT